VPRSGGQASRTCHSVKEKSRGLPGFDPGNLRLLIQKIPLFCGVPFYRLAINFDPADVGISARAVTASRSQVAEADRLDFTEVYFVEQCSLGLHFGDVQLEPAHFGKIELAL